jgi:hypothetical protein
MPNQYIPRPVPGAGNGGQTDLEYAAIIQRGVLIPKNLYNSTAAANQYSLTHTRAITDNQTVNAGRGTGTFLDINNYGAGLGWDRTGNPNPGSIVGAGIGRSPSITINNATWQMGPTALNMQNYSAPNMSLNVGQVTI